MNAFEAQLYGAFARMDAKSKRGGVRTGAGRKPGTNGKRIDKNIALTADVWAFIVSNGLTAGAAIEAHYRADSAFVEWMQNKIKN